MALEFPLYRCIAYIEFLSLKTPRKKERRRHVFKFKAYKNMAAKHSSLQLGMWEMLFSI